ncbi:MAG: gliding motility-associated C-terminal domain-containing protein [Flavipsychrobacter sp.]
MRSTPLVFMLLLVCGMVHAQQQNNVWAMGFGVGVSFNSSPPVGITTSMQSVEAAASVSDRKTGALLFYTDGVNLYDANHNITPNGKGVGDDTTRSSEQGVVIVPFVNDTNKYYLFTISGHSFNGTLSYTVVDKTLNGGLGDVVTGQKNIFLANDFTEAMTVVEQEKCNRLWLIALKKDSHDFYAYEITKDGLDTAATISTVGYVNTAINTAALKISPNRKKIALAAISARQYDGGNSYLAVHDFDIYTGRISNGIVIDNLERASLYGCEFSPNSELLYSCNYIDVEILQFDITLPDAPTIKGSRKVINGVMLATLGGLQMGPDSNIYISKYKGKGLDRISNSNARYPNCVYTVDAITMPSGETGLTMPQPVMYAGGSGDVGHTTSSKDTTVCLQAPMMLRSSTSNGGHTWQDGRGGSTYQVSQSGTYWVRTNNKCVRHTDTINVQVETLSVMVSGGDTTICKGDSVLLTTNTLPASATYKWSNGSTAPSLKVGAKDIYQLIVNYLGCTDTSYASIAHYPDVKVDLGADQQLCKGDELALPKTVVAEPTDKYLWQDGSASTTYTVKGPGTYHLSVSNQCKTVTDTINITERNCHFFFPSVFTPNYDGRNDLARMVGDINTVTDYELRIINRWGEVVFFTDDATKGWDGNYKGTPAEVGTYYYLISYKYLKEKELMKGTLLLLR